jgi:hypothetical protein
MRKVFWYGAIVALASAAVIWGATAYAARHPHTRLAHYVVAAYSAGLRFSTLFQGSEALASQNRLSADAARPAGGLSAEAQPVPILPLDCGVSSPDSPADTLKSNAFSGPFHRLPGKIIIPNCAPVTDLTDPLSGCVVQQSTSAEPAGEALPPVLHDSTVTTRSSEEAPSYMPPCDEPAPAFMALAPDDDAPAADASVFDAFLDMLLDKLQEIDTGTRLDASETEEPLPDGHGSAAGKCQEDPNYFQQYPGCPFTNECPRTDRHAPPLPQTFDKGTEEESGDEARPPAREPMPEPRLNNAGLLPPASIDTMEFRPSDAREGEFDRSPF